MSNSFNTFALKMKVQDCGVELEKELLKFKGVCSVKIDQKLGKVVISGKLDSGKILSKIRKSGREVELWPYEQLKVNDPLNDSDIMAQLKQLSRVSGLHTVEVTKTTKLTFRGESTSNNPGITQLKVLPHRDGGGRLCSASSSCCGSHGGNTSFGSCCANNRNNYSYHNVPVTQPDVLPHGGGGGEFGSASSSCCGAHGGNYNSSGSCCANNRNKYSYHCPRPQPMGYIPAPPVVPPRRPGDRPIPSAPLMPPDYFHQPLPSPPAPSCASFLLRCLK